MRDRDLDTLPVWQSVGPLYLTEAIASGKVGGRRASRRAFSDALLSCVLMCPVYGGVAAQAAVHVLPSRLFFPLHWRELQIKSE